MLVLKIILLLLGMYQESITFFYYYILLVCIIQFLQLNTSYITDCFDLWCKPDERTSDNILHCVSGKVHFFKTFDTSFKSSSQVPQRHTSIFFLRGKQEETQTNLKKPKKPTFKNCPGFVSRRCFKNNSGKQKSFMQDSSGYCTHKVWILGSFHSRVKQISILCFLLLRRLS